MSIVKANKDSRQTVNHFAPLLWCEQLNRHYDPPRVMPQPEPNPSWWCCFNSPPHRGSARVESNRRNGAEQLRLAAHVTGWDSEVFTPWYLRAPLSRWKAPRLFCVIVSVHVSDVDTGANTRLFSLASPLLFCHCPLISPSRHQFLLHLRTA